MSALLQRSAVSLNRTGALVAPVLCALIGAMPVGAEELKYGDGKPDGKKSLTASGHLIWFDAGKKDLWLNGLEVYGGRYGDAVSLGDEFHVHLVGAGAQVYRRVALPYILWPRGKQGWLKVPLPPIQVPQKFGVCLSFQPTKARGVWVFTDDVEDGHSYAWLPGEKPLKLKGGAWMVRATVGEKPEGDPLATDLVVLKSGKAFFNWFGHEVFRWVK